MLQENLARVGLISLLSTRGEPGSVMPPPCTLYLSFQHYLLYYPTIGLRRPLKRLCNGCEDISALCVHGLRSEIPQGISNGFSIMPTAHYARSCKFVLVPMKGTLYREQVQPHAYGDGTYYQPETARYMLAFHTLTLCTF